jgi:rare lipoprotein A
MRLPFSVTCSVLQRRTCQQIGAFALMAAIGGLSQGCASIANPLREGATNMELPLGEPAANSYPEQASLSWERPEGPSKNEVPSGPEPVETPPADEPPEPARPTFLETGLASWYGPRFHGKLTASGEVFNQEKLTAAHPRLPWGSRVKVTNLSNGKSVEVRINDRGPFVKDRIIDVSRAAARTLGMMKSGVTPVQVEWLVDPDMPDQLVLEEKRIP